MSGKVLVQVQNRRQDWLARGRAKQYGPLAQDAARLDPPLGCAGGLGSIAPDPLLTARRGLQQALLSQHRRLVLQLARRLAHDAAEHGELVTRLLYCTHARHL
jgi:hypothetical protein